MRIRRIAGAGEERSLAPLGMTEKSKPEKRAKRNSGETHPRQKAARVGHPPDGEEKFQI